jgi:hypothetical protein
MTFNKQFAPDATGLDDRIEQLVEAIAQLLEDPQFSGAAGANNHGATAAISDLRSAANRAIHVSVGNSMKECQELRSCR